MNSRQNIHPKGFVKAYRLLPPAARRTLYGSAVRLLSTIEGRRSFDFDGRQLPYLRHPYNDATANERTVEVPIAEQFFHSSEVVLEVGNVLNHYHPFVHDVVDKYEMAQSVINCDVAEYDTDRRYDSIISISTLEHVGFDEPVRDPDKPIRAIRNLKRLLKPGGRMLVTVPHGYNPVLDAHLATSDLGFQRHYRYQRVSWSNHWKEVEEIPTEVGYHYPYPFANALHVLVLF